VAQPTISWEVGIYMIYEKFSYTILFNIFQLDPAKDDKLLAERGIIYVPGKKKTLLSRNSCI